MKNLNDYIKVLVEEFAPVCEADQDANGIIALTMVDGKLSGSIAASGNVLATMLGNAMVSNPDIKSAVLKAASLIQLADFMAGNNCDCPECTAARKDRGE